ncbi:MAG: hypothetical protein A2Z99_10825 [Treponema sp. GWB1_62_6]|nr:MAG: hypothetical protein A2Y36_03625 [Treponema sp. GWA1_62_8]OHE62111.1 MAG: hypothetical protein A2Z99_10825 [Treponema sp. GWB1_62_6]OHE63473.1 MAG: hypothetical protein A2001_03415 [Treponema sp. GWC1_61_84]OHE68581.1 MAG: hypothetical protein A2413_12615 [Treponema sp. RIFOXYC1_FULL_61_9]HCM26516.1 hypothetical protein [Treponema sp.]
MIVSASRRTDIPRFYFTWFMNRVREGYVDVASPFDSRKIRRVELLPDLIEAMVFWTRDPRPALPFLGELSDRGFRYYFMTTVTGYPRSLEAGAPEMTGILEGLEELARFIGPDRSIWRYDPVYLSPMTGASWHRNNFARLAEAMEGKTRRVVLSLYEGYMKTERRLVRLEGEGLAPEGVRGADGLMLPGTRALMEDLAATARSRGIDARTCAETDGSTGLPPNACVDAELIGRLWDVEVDSRKDPNQRRACRCAPSVDIGAYDTCPAACAYCYAVGSLERAATRYASHDASSVRL